MFDGQEPGEDENEDEDDEDDDYGSAGFDETEDERREDAKHHKLMGNHDITSLDQESVYRASTAPTHPFAFDDSKSSQHFLMIEQCAIWANQLIQREDEKFDLDSYEG